MAWAHTQTTLGTGAAGAAATVAFTFGGAVSASALVCGCVTYTGTPAQLTSITDDKSNTYTLFFVDDSAGNGGSMCYYYLEGISNGPITVTAHFSPNATDRRIGGSEYSGILTSAAIDNHIGQVQASPGTGANGLTSTAMTTASDGDLIYGCFTEDAAGSPTYTAGTSPNTFLARLNSANGSVALFSEEFRQTTHGSIAATATQGTNLRSLCAVMGFKIAATGDTFANDMQMVMM